MSNAAVFASALSPPRDERSRRARQRSGPGLRVKQVCDVCVPALEDRHAGRRRPMTEPACRRTGRRRTGSAPRAARRSRATRSARGQDHGAADIAGRARVAGDALDRRADRLAWQRAERRGDGQREAGRDDRPLRHHRADPRRPPPPVRTPGSRSRPPGSGPSSETFSSRTISSNDAGGCRSRARGAPNAENRGPGPAACGRGMTPAGWCRPGWCGTCAIPSSGGKPPRARLLRARGPRARGPCAPPRRGE